jgi:hypothetical protein
VIGVIELPPDVEPVDDAPVSAAPFPDPPPPQLTVTNTIATSAQILPVFCIVFFNSKFIKTHLRK